MRVQGALEPLIISPSSLQDDDETVSHGEGGSYPGAVVTSLQIIFMPIDYVMNRSSDPQIHIHRL